MSISFDGHFTVFNLFTAVDNNHDNLWDIDCVASLIKGLATFTFGLCTSALYKAFRWTNVTFCRSSRTHLISGHLNVTLVKDTGIPFEDTLYSAPKSVFTRDLAVEIGFINSLLLG